MLLDVARELPLGQGASILRLGLDESVVVVERELRIDGDVTVDTDDRVHPLAGVERVLHLVRPRRQPVAKEVLEQQLAEPASCLRRSQRLLEACQVLRALEHLCRRLVDLTQAFVDLDRRLRRVLEAPVDLRVELGQAAIHGGADALEPAVEFGIPLGKLGLERREETWDPDRAGGRETEQDEDDEDCADHRADER